VRECSSNEGAVSEESGLRTLSRGDVVGRRYEIVRLLGEGLLGSTYEAQALAGGKQVVVKFIRPRLVRNPKDRESFEQAFRRARAIKGPGLIEYGELGNFENTVFFTQKFFSGTNLRQLIHEYATAKKAFSLQEACQIILKVLQAVQILHENGLYHRNLKPENILVQTQAVGPGGQVVRTVQVTDAGLADIVNPTLFAESYISRNEARYLAPELGGFDQDGSSASDIYSIGVMLYEILIGQPPRGTYLSPTQLRGDLPEHIDDVVEVAMAAEAEDRYPSVKDMVNDIQSSFQGLILSQRPRTSLKNIMIGLGLALSVIGLAGMYVSTLSPEETKQTAQEKAKTEDDRIRMLVMKKAHQPSEAELQAMVAQHPDMLYIAPGPFMMGRMNQESMEHEVSPGRVQPLASQTEPLTRVVDVPGFYVDRYEFPNRVKTKDGTPVQPHVSKTWQNAQDACTKVGKRLCTEEEWEKACKGPENSIYSYDDIYDAAMCGEGVDGAHALGSNTACISGYGVADLSGNVREWTASIPGTKKKRGVVKGGLRSNNLRGSRCAFATDENKGYADHTLGFRCCLSLPPTD
jgi:serine/threonine protein kinase